MKTLHLLVIAASIAFVAGCASPSNDPRQHPPTAISSPSAGWLVVSAVYGSGVHYTDVTYRVDELLRQPNVEFFARPEWLHADPTPGWNKALVIIYEFNGRRHIFTTGEGGRVSLGQLIHLAKKDDA